ncbi:LysR family transcriptional regulator [Kribbella sp. NBC_01484]|uniref:LysR family transcriptional regulator n=1 Tax=Kribbella sp. NBC_01484 TaxID=2903579 RepID=UPI002E322A13|nr:LysR family transcriptional regulator [Kribbella sp. NBC_01484]
MDPHLLRTFVAVAECGSFSAAADRLGYTQSAVSQHIAALEHDLGTPLLRRRPVVPTPAGERLLEHAAPILLRLDAARADVRRTIADPPGTLTIAASPLAAADGRLAIALREVRRSRPGTEVTLTVCGREAVAEGVAAGEFALGLVDGVAAPSDPLRLSDAGSLRTTAVAHQQLVVGFAADHPLARRRGISLHDLTNARWIDAPDLAAPLPTLRTATGSDALRPALAYAGTDLKTLLTLIAAGHGLAVLPHSATQIPADPHSSTALPGIAAVPVTAPRLVHRIELLHGHLTEPAASALAAVLSH